MLSTQPKTIERSVPSRVRIEWGDGEQSLFSAADLRRVCPCAACVSEATGIRTHDPKSVPEDLTQANLHLIGNYAVSMQFSDGHSTGIFTFQFLRNFDSERSGR
jgi:DUF971 family protein